MSLTNLKLNLSLTLKRDDMETIVKHYIEAEHQGYEVESIVWKVSQRYEDHQSWAMSNLDDCTVNLKPVVKRNASKTLNDWNGLR